MIGSDLALAPCTSQAAAQAAPQTAPPPSGRRSSLLDRAYSEYCRQQDAGVAPPAGEFCARYPAIQHSLAQLLCVHHAVQDEHSDFVAPEPIRWPDAGESFLDFQLQRELGRG